MILFIKLLLAHLIGDFFLQPLRAVIHKEAHKAKSWFLYLHVALHFLLIILFLWDFSYWEFALVIAVSHYFIDLSKLYTNSWYTNKAIPFLLDQLAHLAVLYVVAFYHDLPEHTVQWLVKLDWALITAIVFVSFPAAIIMSKLMENMSNQIELDHKSLPNAGKYIGIMERLFVLLFIIVGRWEAIGLLIAAKSVFRFNDLKESNNRKLTEYILIGTLLSFGIAMLTGILYTNL